MKPVVLTIPAPCDRDGKPLWLRLNGGHGNRYARNNTAQQWRQTTAALAMRDRLPKIAEPVRIIATVHLDTKSRHWDAGNWLPTAKHCIDGLVRHPRYGGADVLVDDCNCWVTGPDMRPGEPWADAALVLTISPIEEQP